MRILYLGSLSPNACSGFYATAAQQLGHTVFKFDPAFFECSSWREKLQLKFTKNPPLPKIQWAEEQIIQICKENKIEVVLNIAENFISLETLYRLKELPQRPKILYHSHDNNFSSGILKPSYFFESLSHYDLVFTTKSQNLQKYKMLGQLQSFFIPSAFEPSVHRPVSSQESRLAGQRFAVSFIGTYDRSRDRYLEALNWDNLYVWGDRWKKYSAYRKHKDHIVPHAIYHPDFSDILSHTDIALGLLREEAEDRHTQRTFEIPACGSLQIAPRNDEIQNFFKENEEIVCFDSVEELKEKVSFYLKNDSERQRIARNGYEKVTRSQHTYQDRMSTMLGKLASA